MFKHLKAAAAVVAVGLTVLAPHAAVRQTAATGTIEGIVSDPTGAVLPGVTIVVKNSETGLTRDLVSDESGRYRAAALQPGTYEVAATLSGFQNLTLGNIAVQVGQSIPVDVKMKPAGVSEVITVTGESPIIDTVRTD